MIKTALLGAAACLALTGAVAAQTFGNPSAVIGDQAGHSDNGALSFARKAAQSDEYERRAGRLAVERAGNPAVREFGERMIHDHTQTTDSMNAALAAANLPPQPPPVMTEAQNVMLSQLQGLHGQAFDREYIHQQIVAHKQAISLVKAYADTGSTRPVVAAARQTLPIIEGHLQMAESLEHHEG